MTKNGNSGPRPELKKALQSLQPETRKAPRKAGAASARKSRRASRSPVPIGPDLMSLRDVLSKTTLRALPQAAKEFSMEPEALIAASVGTWIKASAFRPVLNFEPGAAGERYCSPGSDHLVARLIKEAFSTADPCYRYEKMEALHTVLLYHPSYQAEASLIFDVLKATARIGGGGGVIERALSPEELDSIDEANSLRA